MNSVRTTFQSALMAQAVYGSFSVDNGTTIYDQVSLNEALKDASKSDKAEFTLQQAANFTGVQGYILRSFTSDASTGFEAALFESRIEPGKFTLAIRGTAGLADIVGADIFGVVAQGQAAAQSLSLYRYYKRLITPQGAAVQYSQAEIEMLAAVTNRKYDGYGIEFLRTYRDFQQTSASLSKGLRNDSGLGRLSPDAMLDVTGHSLGGHLAQVFGALFFPERIDRIYTYNGAGLGGSVYRIGKKVLSDRSIDLSTKSTNIVAAEGLTLTAAAGYKFGPIQRLAIEEGVLTDNHSIANVTDSLALYALLGDLSPNMSVDNFNAIARAASNETRTSYEATLDAIRRIFLGGNVLPTQRSFRDDMAGRDELYKNIDEVQRNDGFNTFVAAGGHSNAIASLANAGNSAGLAADAANGVAYRYALKHLNPFALIGFDYTQYNQSGELDLHDSATGQGAISKEWLKDRAQFLTWKIQKNTNDIADDVAIRRKDNGAESYLYTDKTLKNSQGQDYSIRVTGGNGAQQINISFAGDQGDALSGGNYADRLYGAKGKDTLTGGEGNDYLEGGAEEDTLRGDAGDDTLIGGKGNDVLQGGGGNDLYVIRAGDGTDRILDHQGSNTVVYEDASGRRTVLGVTAFAVAGLANTWSGHLSSGGTVSLTQNSPLTATLPDGTQIILDGYEDGDFGIHLQTPNQDSPVFTREILGDLVPVEFGEPVHHYEYDDLGNVIAAPGEFGEGSEDHLWGSEGNDLIATGSGADTVIARGGDDRIVASGPHDYLDGGDGDDLIEGGMDSMAADNHSQEMLVGGRGDDRLYANREAELSEGIIAGPPFDEFLRVNGTVLISGDGDDIAVGTDFWDVLYGGMGKDVLAGGGDNDTLSGDKDVELIVINPNYAGAQRSRIAEYPIVLDIAGGDDDILFGGNGDDWVYGNGGDDWMSGGEGHDNLIGGLGSDTLFGDGGSDYLSAASRLFDSAPSDYDVLDGGDGHDGLYGGAGFNLMFGGAGNDSFQNGTGYTFAYGGEGDDEFSGFGSGYSEIYGEAGNDILRAVRCASYLDGGDGADLLVGGDGADVLIGGAGNDIFEAFRNDVLEGGAGDDVFKFRLGGGTNTLIDTEGDNQIALYSFEISNWVPQEISRESIQLGFAEEQYRISYGDRGDRILLGADEFASLQGLTLRHLSGYEYVQPEDEDADAIQVEVFTDDFVLFSDLDLQRLGSDGDDYLDGDAAFKTTLDGKAGDDFLLGTSASDTLIGGSGNDLLLGGAGDDSYLFGPGSGHDVVSDVDATPNNIDTVVLGEGITPGDVSVLRSAGRLTLAFAGSADRLDLQWQPEEGEMIERVQFADGTLWDGNRLESQAVPDPQADAGDGLDVSGGVAAGDGGSAGTSAGGGGNQSGEAGAASTGAAAPPESVATAPRPDSNPVTTEGDSAPALAASVAGEVSLAPAAPPQSDTGFASASSPPVESGGSVAAPASLDKALASSAPTLAQTERASATSTAAEPRLGATSPTAAGSGLSPSHAESGEGGEARGQTAAPMPAAQETFAAALRQLAATEATAATAQSRASARPIDSFDAPYAPAQPASAPSAASTVPATQASQPSLQTWLDNWLGPSARAGAGSSAGSNGGNSGSVRDAVNSLPPASAGQPASVEDSAPPNPSNDTPDSQPTETLTPEQITQRYEDIERWLAANPGIEQGIAGASGSLPQRNLFASLSGGYTRDAGTISMPRFGETPGMNAIAGNTLQPLRGIKEGYTLLGVV